MGRVIAQVAIFVLVAGCSTPSGETTASPTTNSGSPASSEATPVAVAPLATPNYSGGPTAATYVIVAGDSPSRIAHEFGLSLEELLAVNPCLAAGLYEVGDVVVIPTDGASIAPSGRCSVASKPPPSSDLKPILTVPVVRTTARQVVAAIEAAYEAAPEAAQLDLGGYSLARTRILEHAETCESGYPGDTGKLLESDRVVGCSDLVFQLYRVYSATRSLAFYDAAVAAFNYARSDLADGFRENFIEVLTTELAN